MISFINVEKRYPVPGGHKTIIRKLDTTFPRKNIALLGANGAGKSTLLRLIAGAELPDVGIIKRHVDVSFPMGFQGSFNGSLSGLENTLFVARIYGKDTEAVVEYVKEFAELGSHFGSPVRTYSSGMKGRLAFGVSLAVDFQCYLVDEITAVGDQRFKDKSKKAFQEKLEKANIIMVSHDMGTLKSYCDTGVVIRDGETIYYDDLDEAIKDHQAYMKR